jgi:hypothetical protein
MHQKQINRIRSRHWIVTGAFCVGICLTLAAPAPALSKATMQPWCSDPRGSGTGAHNSTCMFYTYEQCMRNAGMLCIPNPSMDPLPQPPAWSFGGSPPPAQAAPVIKAGAPNTQARRTREAR